ncbi:peptidylprolyl isomerase [Flavobacteriaceae bacterium]|nr:peptidylprolyl isomerase [Flavobacteriaceae bacterium]
MRKIILLLVFIFNIFCVFSQKETKTVVTINGEQITVADFKRVYEKNLSAIDNEEAKDIEKNLNLFINFKLKVKEAYEIKLDTLTSYKTEIETYKNQLIAPYLQDKNYLNSLIKEAYNRTKTEIRASHILIKLPRNFKPEDTLKPYNKIIAARNRILAGEPFDKVAKEVSEDPSAVSNGGDLGYFSAFKMLYDFEDAAYKTSLGDVSELFKTRYGYHFIQKTGSRTSKGDIQVAHILIADTSANGKTQIDEVFSKLTNGVNFNTLAKQYSNDRKTKDKGGVLPRFGSGRMVKTFEEMEKEISNKVRKSGRAKLSDNAVLNRLKKEYLIKVIASSKKVVLSENIRSIRKDSLLNILLIINEKKITQSDFVSYILNRRQQPLVVLLEKFIDSEILAYFKENLVNTNTDFANILAEYEDGLLLFELMQQKIWNISSDTLALKDYFDSHKNSYETKDFSTIKGKVMNDFQTSLEKEWIQELRANNKVEVNKMILKKLIKYYRKES